MLADCCCCRLLCHLGSKAAPTGTPALQAEVAGLTMQKMEKHEEEGEEEGEEGVRQPP